MNKKVKKLMSVCATIMSVLVIILFTTINGDAAEVNSTLNVCNYNGTSYATIEEAILAIGNGTGTIQVTKDVVLTDCLFFTEGNITLDLAGHIVDFPNSNEYAAVQIDESATLKLVDSVGTGKLTSSNVYYGIVFVAGGTFTMDSGTIELTNKFPTTNGYGIYCNYGTVQINAGTINSDFPIYTSGKFGVSTLNITGGTFNAARNSVISGETVANISGGKFTVAKTFEEGRALLIGLWSENNGDKTPVVTITGGEFHGVLAGIMVINSGGVASVSNTYFQTNIIPAGYALSNSAILTDENGYIYTDKDVTINAIVYNIKYENTGEANNTSNVNTYTVKDAITLKDISKAGYNFNGWYDSAIGGNKITSIAKGTIGETTLYARFTEIVAAVEPTTESATEVATESATKAATETATEAATEVATTQVVTASTSTKTGDDFPLALMVILCAASASILGLVLISKSKKLVK